MSSLVATTVTLSVAPVANPDGSIDVTLNTANVAVFVVLTTLAQGRFSDNVFVLLPAAMTVQFIPFGPLDRAVLVGTLRVEHLASYLPSS